MRRLFDVCRFFLSPRFSHILSLPHECSPEAVRYYHSELRNFATVLHKAFGKELNEARLLAAINTLNETRLILQQLDGTRKRSAALTDAQYYEAVLQAMTRPKVEFNQVWRARLNELEKDRPTQSGISLVLSGGVLDDLWIIKAIEQAGGHVVADDLCCGSRYFEELVETESDPLLAIAERYVLRVPCARMNALETRINHLLELVEKSGARGVIYYGIKFCDPHLLDWAVLSKELQQRGVPALRCEADYSIVSREPMRTRVDAFLEMLI
jgi:benzoyl-CoA reductase/2-hydroxyglutaryl-CoA dehydratase subunit BcrC/BadD/HgdB